jgi:hypothetical protein
MGRKLSMPYLIRSSLVPVMTANCLSIMGLQCS